MTTSSGADWTPSEPAVGLETSSGAETEDLGRRFAGALGRGDVVLVVGEVGAGKTTFVRGACRGLGYDGPVTSPTFTIGQIYMATDSAGKELPVAHLDLYRLSDLDAEEPGLLDDYIAGDRISFIEWPDAPAGGAAFDFTRRVSIEHAGQDRRLLSIA